MVCPNLSNDRDLLKKVEDDQLRELQYKSEKHDHGVILKNLLNFIVIIIGRIVKV